MRVNKQTKLVVIAVGVVATAYAIHAGFVPTQFRDPGDGFVKKRSGRSHEVYVFDGEYRESLDAVQRVYPADTLVDWGVYEGLRSSEYRSGRYFVFLAGYEDSKGANVCVLSTSPVQSTLINLSLWKPYGCPDSIPLPRRDTGHYFTGERQTPAAEPPVDEKDRVLGSARLKMVEAVESRIEGSLLFTGLMDRSYVFFPQGRASPMYVLYFSGSGAPLSKEVDVLSALVKFDRAKNGDIEWTVADLEDADAPSERLKSKSLQEFLTIRGVAVPQESELFKDATDLGCYGAYRFNANNSILYCGHTCTQEKLEPCLWRSNTRLPISSNERQAADRLLSSDGSGGGG